MGSYDLLKTRVINAIKDYIKIRTKDKHQADSLDLSMLPPERQAAIQVLFCVINYLDKSSQEIEKVSILLTLLHYIRNQIRASYQENDTFTKRLISYVTKPEDSNLYVFLGMVLRDEHSNLTELETKNTLIEFFDKFPVNDSGVEKFLQPLQNDRSRFHASEQGALTPVHIGMFRTRRNSCGDLVTELPVPDSPMLPTP